MGNIAATPDQATHDQAISSPVDCASAPLAIPKRRETFADWLFAWLSDQAPDPLPPLQRIAADLPPFGHRIVTHYTIWNALAKLSREGRIAWRCGTRSLHRGHQAIRIIATGRVLKTAGCPFEPDAPR